jgi:hypothetical protein
MVMDAVYQSGLPLPRALLFPWAVVHMPVGAGAACLLLAWLFPEADRRRVLAWLLAGAGLHLGADLLQDHHGQGYQLGFPLWMGTFELGWMGPEATVDLAPWFAVVTALAWAGRLTWMRWRR